MGNQLAAATSVNVADVSSSLTLVAPLGKEHRYCFRSFHCTKLMSVTNNNNTTETLRSRHLFASPTEGHPVDTPLHHPSQRVGSRDVVLKVFVRTLGDKPQTDLVKLCYSHLQDIFGRMTNTQGSAINTIGSHSDISIAGSDPCVPSSLSPHPCNILFYSRMEVHNDRFCMLERSYVAYSLSERLATRPYWNMGERLFAGYQLLQGLVQLHEEWGTVHGDLKTDNVLVDTSGWIYITDICPFKPGLLPAENPALFNCYYDTNETHICFLAPEKFRHETLPFNTSNVNAHNHTKAMDIFSAACVLAHIFTEEPLFPLSETLTLRLLQTQEERESKVSDILTERGVSPIVRCMLLDMLCNAPETRPTARQLLETFTPSVFPSYFGFIYRDILPPLLARPPDLQVQLLDSRLQDILKEVERHCNSTDFAPNHLMLVKDAKQLSVQLLLPVILNASLHLVTDDAFCRLVSILQKILPHCSSEVQKNTLLPYVLHYLKAKRLPVVARILSLRTLSTICHSIPFSASDATIFDDLILPSVEDLLKTDANNVALLVEVADQLPGILQQARTFLEHRQVLASANTWHGSFRERLNTLLERGWDALRSLYRQSHTTVVVVTLRRTVDVVKFLGEERVQDDLIPLLTTAITSAIDVQRELYPQAILCHMYLQVPKLKTLRFFVEEGLKQTDVTCLERTIDSIAVIVEKKCFAVWEVMPLVHQALPYIMSSNNLISSATSRMVEKVTSTHRASDILMYLQCVVQPFLRYPVPLSRLSSFSTAVRTELSDNIHFGEQMFGTMRVGVRFLGGDADSHERVLCRSTNHIPQYDTFFLNARRSLRDLDSHVASVDVTLDLSMLKPESSSTATVDERLTENCKDDTWELYFKPTWRERKRILLRQKQQVTDNGDFNGVPSLALERQHSGSNMYLTRGGRGHRRHDSKEERHSIPHIANVTLDEKELNPIAAPWFTRKCHLGGIYCCSAAHGETLVTAGGRGEAFLWSLGSKGIDYSYSLQTGAAPTSTFLFVNFLREGQSPLLSMGGTDGEWRVFDVACNNIVFQRTLDGSALTSACTLGDYVTLVSSALGGVFAIDSRVRKEVWQTKLSPAIGPPSGISPLFLDSRAYGASVVSLAAGVALFDLRFQMLLKEYRIGSGGNNDGGENSRSSRPSNCIINNPNAILCVSPDTTFSFSLEKSHAPGLFLGTQSGTVHWMDLSSGETRVALQPATIGEPTRALLVQPKHSVVMTAGNDMWIRKWCLSAPNQSKTLVCSPYVSPSYTGTVGGGIVESTSRNHLAAVQPAHLNEWCSNNHEFQFDDGLVPRHHEDAILTMCSVSNGNTSYLASGSRDGTLTVWLNEE